MKLTLHLKLLLCHRLSDDAKNLEIVNGKIEIFSGKRIAFGTSRTRQHSLETISIAYDAVLKFITDYTN